MTVCSLLVNFKSPTGGTEMSLHSFDDKGNMKRVSASLYHAVESLCAWLVSPYTGHRTEATRAGARLVCKLGS